MRAESKFKCSVNHTFSCILVYWHKRSVCAGLRVDHSNKANWPQVIECIFELLKIYCTKMNYKIVFMSNYDEVDVLNDNLDLKVVLSSHLVYSGTLYTVANITSLIEVSDLSCFRAEDMLIVNDLSFLTINKVIKSIVDGNLLDSYMSIIGTVKEIFMKADHYEEIKNYGSPVLGFYK